MDDAATDPEPMMHGQDLVISTDSSVVTAWSYHARNALQSAEAEARSAPGGVLTGEHLLLGLARDPDCAAARVLGDCGFDDSVLRAMIAFIRGEPSPTEPAGFAVRSPRVERVLANAAHEAARRHCDQIDTLHMLIGLLHEGTGIAALVLESPGIGHEHLGNAIARATRDGVTDPS